ncbi:MAG: S8 family serine peptidase [Candidatus Limnocylindrales bacterium]
MGPRSVQRQRDAHADDRAVPGRPHQRRARRALAVLGAGVLLLLPAAPSAATAIDPGDTRITATADQGAAREWIVTLEAASVAPVGVGVSGRRYRLDTSSGRAAARDRADLAGRVIGRIEDRRGVRASKRFTWAMQGFAARMTASQAAALRTDPSVASVVPVAPVSIAADTVPEGIERIGAVDGIATGEDVDIDVAVIDTGVGPVGGPAGARELDIRGGTDCRPTRRSYPDPGSYVDGHGHGTHVAGTIAARANGVGVVGVAPGARIWAVRVFDASGSGTTASVICGVEWVTRWLAEHPGRPMVVNMSLRGPDDYRGPRACDANGLDPRDPEHQAICTAARAGAVFAVAAGNESDDAGHYIPARYAEVITVGAMSDFDGRPGAQSTRSRLSGCPIPSGREGDDRFASYSNHGSAVDVVAPGTCVRSLAPSSGTSVPTAFMTGTSMATPHVAGTIARYLAVHPAAAADVPDRLIGASGLDWLPSSDPAVRSDPAATPLRVVDAGALLAASPGIRAWARRSTVTAGHGVSHRTIRLEIQRRGGLEGPIGVDIDGLPAGVSIAGDAAIAGIRGNVVLDIDPGALEGNHRLRVHAGVGDAGADTAVTLRIDREAPDVASSRPRVRLGTGGTFDGAATVRVSWTATDPVSGVDRTELQRQRRGSWTRLARSRERGSLSIGLDKGTSARFRIVARDRAGNTAVSPVVATRLVVRDSAGERVTWTGSWRTSRLSSASGQSVRTARGAGAQATLRFTGRAVAVVAPRGPGKGRIDVSIDGVRVATVDLSASRTQPRRIVFASEALVAGDHVITVRTRRAGTQLDAILVLE